MNQLLAVEFLKLRTQRAIRMVLLAALGLTVGGFAMFVVAVETTGVPGFDLSTGPVQRQLLGTGGGSFLVLVFAVLGITSEYRHRTITSTFLSTPQRHRVILAKLVTYCLVAVGFGIVLAVIITVCMLAYMGFKDVSLVVPWSRLLTDYLRDLAGLAMQAAFGFAVGALVANQIAGIVIVLGETFVSGLMSPFLPKIARFLPSQAFNYFGSEAQFFPSEYSLSRGMAALVILGYVTAMTAAALYLTRRRDIT